MVHFPNSTDLSTPCNFAINETSLCTYQTCCIAKQGRIEYLPSFPGNVTYAAIFAVVLLVQLFLGIRYKTWSFLTWMSIGIFGEIIGYFGRIWLYFNIFNFDAFLTYLIPLTIAPAFLTASIYLCLSRVVIIYDPLNVISRLKPMTYTKIFVPFDFVALLLQGAGGGVTASAAQGDHNTSQMGINIMIAGLAFQVFSLIVFMALCFDFAYRVYQRSVRNSSYIASKIADADVYGDLKSSRRFQGFLLSIVTATTLILIRSCYRLAELQQGFSGSLANNQTLFMILEGPMIIGAVTSLTIFHPGFCLKEAWSGVFKTSAVGRQTAQRVKTGGM